MAWGFPTLTTSLVFQRCDMTCVQKLNFNWNAFCSGQSSVGQSCAPYLSQQCVSAQVHSVQQNHFEILHRRVKAIMFFQPQFLNQLIPNMSFWNISLQLKWHIAQGLESLIQSAGMISLSLGQSFAENWACSWTMLCPTGDGFLGTQAAWSCWEVHVHAWSTCSEGLEVCVFVQLWC